MTFVVLRGRGKRYEVGGKKIRELPTSYFLLPVTASKVIKVSIYHKSINLHRQYPILPLPDGSGPVHRRCNL